MPRIARTFACVELFGTQLQERCGLNLLVTQARSFPRISYVKPNLNPATVIRSEPTLPRLITRVRGLMITSEDMSRTISSKRIKSRPGLYGYETLE